MFHYNDVRKYTVPANVFKSGKNEIVVRCLDTGGQGGFIGTPEQMYLQFADGTKQMLDGTWKYQVGADLAKSKAVPQMMDNGNPNIPTVLYNGMIYPLQPIAIKGAIWYQGESNADRADQYRRLLPTMIGDWRREWHEGDFPFFIVQLANFMAPDNQPVDSQWAELREAQTETAKDVRNAGLALAIDIGDAQDIHPKDKQDVGLRLALAALHVAYHQNLPYSGPTYRSQRIEGHTIRLSFDNAFGGLKAKGDALKGFAIAGSDGKFHWADAKIDGNSVIVQSVDVPSPVAVRYDWGNNPSGNLYNSSDLPTVPFKTDDWPWVTAGRK
jgi:sialate O-acetylesterase